MPQNCTAEQNAVDQAAAELAEAAAAKQQAEDNYNAALAAYNAAVAALEQCQNGQRRRRESRRIVKAPRRR